MTRRSLVLFTASLAGSLALLPSTARAAIGAGALPQMMTIAAASFAQCGNTIAPAVGIARVSPSPARLDKASAILGGQPSRLEQIYRQQAGLVPAVPIAAIEPRPMPNVSGITACDRLALPSATFPGGALGTDSHGPGPDDFLASKRLRIHKTGFDNEWDRVQRQGLSRGVARELSRMSAGHSKLALLAAVNAWANDRIRYVEDRDLYGKADYWASAATTLRRRAGDCEDIAIAKLQLLAALGVPRSDMYLTVARDLARNADHAMLVVKLDGRNWLLDNATSEVLDATRSYDYRPIMSFSTSGKWLHGYAGL